MLLCSFSLTLFAQQVYFCESYSQTGEPKGITDKWAFDKNGTEVVFLYNNGKTTFDFASIFFLVEEISSKETNKVEMKVYQNKNWEAKKYIFKKEGEYTVSVFGNDNKILASGKLQVGNPVVKAQSAEQVKETEKVDVKKSEPSVLSSKEAKEVLYYDGIKVIFCEQFKDGKIINEKTDFKLGDIGTYVEIVLRDEKPLNTDVVMVDIWKKESEGSSFSEYIDDLEIKLNPKSKQVNFHRSFFKPGEYKVSFFNNKNVWMTTGYVTVSK